MASRKRKSEGSASDRGQKTGKVEVCVIHFDYSNCESFQRLSDCKGPENRLEKLQDIARRRLAEDEDSPHRMESSCKLLPEELLPEHGYHRDCYQRFTKNLDRLKGREVVQEQTRKSDRAPGTSEKVIFKPDCIFCNKEGRKKIKVKGSYNTEATKFFEREGWLTVVETAERKGDEKLLKRIRGFDLFASEARYHASCRRNYVKSPTKPWQSTDEKAKNEQSELEESHKAAFEKVCEVIDREIIYHQNIMKLTDLCDMHKAVLQETKHANPKYRAEKLKVKLEKNDKYRKKLCFCLTNRGKYHMYLVYSSAMSNNTAVMLAYELGSADMTQDVALYLRNKITEAFQEAEDLPWPPSDDFLRQSDVLPSDLERFLNFLLGGKEQANTARVQRLVYSLGQDICRAVTKGHWKLPKHILLCMTLRHLFRSEQLTTMMNRFGHSESYRFSLELETVLAKCLEESASLLTTQIVMNPTLPSLFHSEFDNFDQLLTVLEGKGSIHTAHGIMLQEVHAEEPVGTKKSLPAQAQTGQQSLQISHEELPDCYIASRKSPNFQVVHKTVPGGQEAQQKAGRINLLWILSRLRSSTEQGVPGWSGFVSLTGEKPTQKTTIDYYPVIFHPITEYKTVKECLRQAESATAEVGQEYVITTFDLGVCMKAYPLVWNQPDLYQKHIILMGTFHLVSAYLKMIGKKMDGSGLSDILLEAELISSGSLKGVLSGKQYDRSLHCHKVMLESLERLLLQSYLKAVGVESSFPVLPDETKTLLDAMMGASTGESVTLLLEDKGMAQFMGNYEQYREDIRQGKHGKTPQFWLSYMDHIWLALSLLYAVKVNDFELYAQCLLEMPDLFFSFGGQNYARYLTFFGLFIANIEVSHPGATELMRRGAFSVARSFIPGNRCATDKTMEETFMRHAKSKGGAAAAGTGVTGISSNYQAYQKWVRTTHERTKYLQATLDKADMSTCNELDTQHRDLRPTEVIKSETCVERTLDAVQSFTNPFEIAENEKLVMLSSGATVHSDVEKDVLRAEAAGGSQKQAFIAQRLELQDHFFDPVKKLKLKTMADTSKKVTLKSTQNKLTEFKHQGNVAFQLLVKSQEGNLQQDLKHLMSFQLTPVPYSLATADNFLAKTDKSTGFHYLTKTVEDADFPPAGETLTIIDGNATFHEMQQVPPNFKQICQKVYEMTPSTSDIVFSTDMYQESSIKSMERKRRGCAEKIILKGDSTKRPADWKSFLSNDENKQQLIHLLTEVWSKDSFAHKLKGRKTVLISEGKALKLTSADGKTTVTEELETLTLTQEETDSRIILYCLYGQERGYKYVRVKSPDTDVFFILLHFAPQLSVTILFDTGKGNKKRLIDISALAAGLTQPFCTALLSLHAFSGCDTTSAFKGKGKVKPIKVLQQKPAFVQTMAQLGDSWEVKEELMDVMEAFTCCMYSRPRFAKVDELRHQMLKEKCGDEVISASQNIDLGTLPPCRRSLKQHVRRCNYQVAIWKCADIPQPDIPPPTDGHGWFMHSGVLEPLWTEEEEELTLPQAVIDDLLANECESADSDEEDGGVGGFMLQNDMEDWLDSDSSESD